MRRPRGRGNEIAVGDCVRHVDLRIVGAGLLDFRAAGRVGRAAFALQHACGGKDLRGYIGAMAVSNDGRFIAASAPKAGHVLYVDSETGQVVGKSDLKDVCGLSSEGEHDFAASSGFGVIRYETAQARVISEHELQDIAFDNHLRRIA